MITYKGPEKRQFERVPVAARIAVERKSDVQYVFTKDISFGGVGIQSEQPLKIGDVLFLEIAITGLKGLIKASGIVVREIESDKFRYGVRFTKFAPHSKKRLKEIIEKLDALPPKK